MNKAIAVAAVCCTVLAGCTTWARTDNGYYSAWVRKPDPRYPNVFVYPPTAEHKQGYAVVDQDPIVIRKGQRTTVSWAVDATGDYELKSIEFYDPQNGKAHREGLDCVAKRKTLDCSFSERIFETTRNGKLGYRITVGLPGSTRDDVITDPGVWMVD